MLRLWRSLGTAWVADATIEAMIAEAERAYPLETGGVLVGYWTSRFDQVVITNATGPGPRARHLRDSFVPDADYHEREIARYYEQSGQLHTYLGDWHTHPDRTATLSRRDHRTLGTIAACPSARAPAPIMAILRGGTGWSLHVWRLATCHIGSRRISSRLVQLEPRIFAAN